MTDPFQPMKRTGFELQCRPIFSIVWVLSSILIFYASARTRGGEEFYGKSANNLPAAYACVIKNGPSGLYAIDKQTGQILRAIVSIKGPTRLEIYSDGLFYKNDNPRTYSALKQVYFTVLGPLKDAFAGTFPSEDAPISLELLAKKPPFKLVWDTPKFSKRKTETFIIFASPQRLVASESSNFYTSSTMLDNLLLQIKFSKE